MSERLERSVDYELGRVPRPLAEELDQSLAIAALKKYETRRSPSGVLRSAWNYAEYALNTRGAQKSEREEYFQISQYLTGMVLMDQKAHQDVTLNALTLSTYLPLFERRADEEAIDAEDCDAIYSSLGRAMQYLRPLEIEEPPQWRMAEVGTLALSARARQPHLLLYPTSPREEASGIQSLNHDSYFYRPEGKIPVQQKLMPTQKLYDESVQILTLQPLLDLSLRKTGEQAPDSLAEKVNYLLALIIAETTGAGISRDEMKFLNSMTEAVVAHYFDAAPVSRLERAA